MARIELQGASVIIQYRAPGAEAIAARQAYLLASTAALDTPLMANASDAPSVTAIAPLMLAQGLPRPPSAPGLAPGLYVQVVDGLIRVSNPAGSANFSAGQFGYTPSFRQPPVVVPPNPGIQFTPPPAFSSASPSSAASSSPAKSAIVDCMVR